VNLELKCGEVALKGSLFRGWGSGSGVLSDRKGLEGALDGRLSWKGERNAAV